MLMMTAEFMLPQRPVFRLTGALFFLGSFRPIFLILTLFSKTSCVRRVQKRGLYPGAPTHGFTTTLALICCNRFCDFFQNPRAAATPVQCNNEGHTSVCRCCCYRDACGANTLDCTGAVIWYSSIISKV